MLIRLTWPFLMWALVLVIMYAVSYSELSKASKGVVDLKYAGRIQVNPKP
jgi:hypothetical protein